MQGSAITYAISSLRLFSFSLKSAFLLYGEL
jgi:hypothetical protein